MRFQITILLLILTIFSSCKSDKDNRLLLIIDADTANEVDDLYAITRALLAPELNIRGITAAQFHTSPLASDTTAQESQAMNKDIMRLLDRQDVPIACGDNHPLSTVGNPTPSAATQLIITEAHKVADDDTLHIVILGSCTNVASALLIDPTIIPKLAVHYIGFWHNPITNAYDKKEFNSGNDTLAVEILLNTPGLNFNVMTATTCQHLVFDKSKNDQELKGKGGISDHLTDRWESYDRWWTEEDPEKQRWIMWDVAIIQALIHPEMATIKMMSTPPENTPRQIGIYTDIDVSAMEFDFWNTIEDFNNRN